MRRRTAAAAATCIGVVVADPAAGRTSNRSTNTAFLFVVGCVTLPPPVLLSGPRRGPIEACLLSSRNSSASTLPSVVPEIGHPLIAKCFVGVRRVIQTGHARYSLSIMTSRLESGTMPQTFLRKGIEIVLEITCPRMPVANYDSLYLLLPDVTITIAQSQPPVRTMTLPASFLRVHHKIGKSEIEATMRKPATPTTRTAATRRIRRHPTSLNVALLLLLLIVPATGSYTGE
jgi:hypothetical protein